MSTAAPGTHPGDLEEQRWRNRVTHDLQHVLNVMRAERRPGTAHDFGFAWFPAQALLRKHADALAAELKAEGWNVE